VTPRSFTVRSGSIDPTTGVGTLELAGSLKFRHGDHTVVFKHLRATLGPGGALKSGATPIFGLDSGNLSRAGFGAQVSQIDVSFLKRTARKVSRKLGLETRLHRADAGSLSVMTQPETVEVIGGESTVVQDLSPSGIAPKLRAHCIDPVDGITPSGEATEPGAPGNFLIPVSGGTISPNGWTAGVVDLAGGMDVDVGGPGLPAGCPTGVVATVHFSNLAVNVENKSVLTDFSVSGPYSPWPGMVLNLELQGDTSNATMLADPANHVLTASGAQLGLDQAAAMVMNNYLPRASGGAPDFAVGDVLGSAAMTVNTR
jgi:hypothetical protein